MKLTQILQKTAAGMVAFVMVIMAAVLTLGAIKPAWAAEENAAVAVTINGVTTYYASLDEVVTKYYTSYYTSFLSSGHADFNAPVLQIKLLQDVILSEKSLSTQNYQTEIDLNGYVLEKQNDKNLVAYGNDLVINDSRPTIPHYYEIDADGIYHLTDTMVNADQVVYGGVITGGYLGINVEGVYDGWHHKAVLNGGNIIGCDECGVICYEGLGFEINGGTIIGNGVGLMFCDEKVNFVINDGIINNNVMGAFYIELVNTPEKLNITINGGQINGKTIFVRLGESVNYEIDETRITLGENAEIKCDADNNIVGYGVKVVTKPEVPDGNELSVTPEDPDVPVIENQDDDKKFPWVPVVIGAGVVAVALIAAITAACLAGRHK